MVVVEEEATTAIRWENIAEAWGAGADNPLLAASACTDEVEMDADNNGLPGACDGRRNMSSGRNEAPPAAPVRRRGYRDTHTWGRGGGGHYDMRHTYVQM